MVTTKSRKGRQLPQNRGGKEDVRTKGKGKRTLSKYTVPRAAGPRSSTRRKDLEERARARREDVMSEDSDSDSDPMEATENQGSEETKAGEEERDDETEEEDSDDGEGDVLLTDLVQSGSDDDAQSRPVRDKAPQERRSRTLAGRHAAVAGQADVGGSAGRRLRLGDLGSSEEENSDSDQEGEELGDAAEADPSRLREDWSPTARFEGIVKDIKTLSKKLGPGMGKMLREKERLAKYSEALEENGVVETKLSLRVRVEKVGRDTVFDHVKFATAMNVHLFQHSAIIMRMVCKELNMDTGNVDANQWAKMVRWVRKGLADRRNSTRSMLRTEIKALYNSAEYKRVMNTASPSEMIGRYRLITLVRNCFLGEGKLPDSTWRSLGEEELENVKDYLKETVFPYIRRWWLTVAVRCGVRRREWTSAMKQGWPISKVCRLSTEAYIMTAFDNNALQWEAEFVQGEDPKSEGFPKSRFTGRLGRTSCLGFKGWNDDGIRAYNHNHKNIKGWRVEKVRVDLENALRSEFKGDANEAKKKREAAEKRLLRAKMEISVRPVDSCAEYEQWLDNNSGGGTENGGAGDYVLGPPMYEEV